jgi:hypothetical protein
VKRKKTQSPQKGNVAEMLQRVRDYQPAQGSFSYAERGQAVTEAHRLYNDSFQLTKIFPMDSDLSEACTEAHRLWFTAIDNAYPRGFGEDVQRLRAGDPSGMEAAVSFLEADPWFYRTGYIKSKLIRYIKPPMLTPEYVRRLQQVVLAVVDKRDDRDFRAYCRLAFKVDSLELREQLTRRLTYQDANVRRRARWVLEALGEEFPQG